MSDLIWLSEAQMRRIEPYFPLSHGVPRVDDRRIISGIIFVIRNGLRWRDAPADYGPPKTIYNRFIRWSRLGVFNKIFSALSAQGGKPDQLMIDPAGRPGAFRPMHAHLPYFISWFIPSFPIECLHIIIWRINIDGRSILLWRTSLGGGSTKSPIWCLT